MRSSILAMGLVLMAITPVHGAEPVRLHAAGSLRDALSEVAAAYTRQTGIAVTSVFGPSGTLKDRIAAGEPAQVFASANMEHPQALAAMGKAEPAARFARNRLCALARPEVEVTTATLLDALLDPARKLGTSTPKADPSGDYAWEVFRKADALRPGSRANLEAKALRLTGGSMSFQAPPGRSAYGMLLAEHKADIILAYCTSAGGAAKELPGLKVVALPEALAVGADYGLTILRGSPPEAHAFARFILSPAGQAILVKYGFAGAE
jgi:ABC-type molybdate transport system substrate-binding protein